MRSRRRRAAGRAQPGRAAGVVVRRLTDGTLHRLVRRPPLAECWPRPSVMGVVNVTPDSFSDGGREPRPRRRGRDRAAAARRGRGARRRRRRVDPSRRRARCPSTRSCGGSCRCSRSSRALPVSIDTSKAEVARRALELGASLVNDVTALRGDPELAGVIADAGAYVCLMHMQGEPRTMQRRAAVRRRRRRGRAASSRSGSRSPSRPGSPRSTSASTPGSGSARRPTRTWR